MQTFKKRVLTKYRSLEVGKGWEKYGNWNTLGTVLLRENPSWIFPRDLRKIRAKTLITLSKS